MTDIGSLLESAATLMITGMVAVFLFLTILVFLVSTMAKLVPREEPEPASNSKNITNSKAINPKVIAAITSAIHQYRRRNSK